MMETENTLQGSGGGINNNYIGTWIQRHSWKCEWVLGETLAGRRVQFIYYTLYTRTLLFATRNQWFPILNSSLDNHKK